MKVITKKDGRVRVFTQNDLPTLTKQEFKEQCDINHIIAKYRKTGELPIARKNGVFADVSNITDYHDMVGKIQNAQNAFMYLPADLRARFNNDPGALLSFLQDPTNLQEAIKLGLVEAKKEQQTSEQITNEPNEQKISEKKATKKAQDQPKPPDEQ